MYSVMRVTFYFNSIKLYLLWPKISFLKIVNSIFLNHKFSNLQTNDLCEMQMCDLTGNPSIVYKTNKSGAVFLNSVRNVLFSIFSGPVCGAALLLIRACQEVEQMWPWNPSGPCTPASSLPQLGRRIVGSSQRGAAPTKKQALSSESEKRCEAA